MSSFSRWRCGSLGAGLLILASCGAPTEPEPWPRLELLVEASAAAITPGDTLMVIGHVHNPTLWASGGQADEICQLPLGMRVRDAAGNEVALAANPAGVGVCLLSPLTIVVLPGQLRPLGAFRWTGETHRPSWQPADPQPVPPGAYTVEIWFREGGSKGPHHLHTATVSVEVLPAP